jgi:hypothetical protein
MVETQDRNPLTSFVLSVMPRKGDTVMACVIARIRMSGVLMHRASWLFFAGAILGTLCGCTAFQSMCTNDWFNAKWYDLSPEQPVSQVLARWERQVRIVPDSVNRGAVVPILAGRLYLFNEETQATVDAHGTVIVQMHDITQVASGKAAEPMAQWRFDAERLKTLRHKDPIGEGYTLVLPWYEYRSDIKEVRIEICFVPDKGTPRYTQPQNLTLQPADQLVPVVEHHPIVPGVQPRPFTPAAPQQFQQQVVPASAPPQAIPNRN